MSFLLFAGEQYYPRGGAEDFQIRGTIEECKAQFESHCEDEGWQWAHIADPNTLEILWSAWLPWGKRELPVVWQEGWQ